jgi:hypothetical protein
MSLSLPQQPFIGCLILPRYCSPAGGAPSDRLAFQPGAGTILCKLAFGSGRKRLSGLRAGEVSIMSLGTIILIILILMLLGAIPSWPHSRGWGYGPSGALGVVLIIVIILLLTGRM